MPEHGTRGRSDSGTYLICGCGSVGYLIVEQLKNNGVHLFLMDKEDERVHELREQNLEAVQRDMNDPLMLQGIPPFQAAFLVSDNHEANFHAVKLIRKEYPHVFVVARAIDPISERILRDAGADLVLYPQQVVSETAVRFLKGYQRHRISKDLEAVILQCTGTFCIVAHTNPDPDAISCAMALEMIVAHVNPGLKIKILYDGDIGHQENRALVNLLNIKMDRLDSDLMAACDHFAIVDSPGPGINNGLNSRITADVIIDHHPEPASEIVWGGFRDVRPGFGSCATILTQYLQELQIQPDVRVATALMYGIRSDTKHFRRNVSIEDLNASAYLINYIDSDLLEKIMSPQFSHETLDILGKSITNRRAKNGYLFSNIGYVRNRDALPQAADLLINLEGISTALVYGITDDAIIISGRNRDMRLNLGNVMSESFGKIGDAGGHVTMAAASIPLRFFSEVKEKEDLLNLIIDPLLLKFYRLVGLLEDKNGEL